MEDELQNNGGGLGEEEIDWESVKAQERPGDPRTSIRSLWGWVERQSGSLREQTALGGVSLEGPFKGQRSSLRRLIASPGSACCADLRLPSTPLQAEIRKSS